MSAEWTDPFEWAQSRMPEGWYVEGQVLPIMRTFYLGEDVEGGWFASAIRNDVDQPCDCVFGGWFRRDGRGGVTLRDCRRHRPVLAYGYTIGFALANLVRKVA